MKTFISPLSQVACDLNKRAMGIEADFLACLCNVEDVTSTNYVLILSCFPIHMRDQANRRILSEHLVNFKAEGSSEEPLCNDDKAFVLFSEAISLKESNSTKDHYLR